MQSLEEKIQSEFRILQEAEPNQRCCDCKTLDPQWGCITHGIFLCLQCAGAHRSMGSQISIVRSIRMDTWDDFQLTVMKLGGNQKFSEFLSVYKLSGASMIEKYNSSAAVFYRKMLRAQALNEPFEEETPSLIEGALVYTPAGDQPPVVVEQQRPANKVKEAFVKFGMKVKSGAKSFSEKPKVVEIKEKTQQFFLNVNSKILDTVQKTKESKAYIKIKEGSGKAFQGVAAFTKKTLDKMKKKEPET